MSPKSSRRVWRSRLIAPLAALVAGALALAGASPAMAATTPQLTTSIDAVTSSVVSGAPALYRVTYACSNVSAVDCAQPTLTMDRPVGTDPSGTAVPTTGTATVTGNADVASVTGTDRLVIVLNDLHPGATGELQIGWTIPTNTTLPGTTFPGTIGSTYQPGAGATPITGADVVTPTPVTSTAAPQIRAFKNMVTPANSGLVTPDTDVTYLLYACNPVYNGQGSLNYRDLTVVDELPKGTVFVSATGGGSYDPVAETVTWSVPNPTPAGCGTAPADASFQLTVRYPASSFVPAPANPAQANTFVNQLQVAATAIDGTPLSATASQTHTFTGDPLFAGSGTIVYRTQKGGPANGTVANVDTATNQQWNTIAGWHDTAAPGNGGIADPTRLRVWSAIDRLPCLADGKAESPTVPNDTTLTNYPGSYGIPADQCHDVAFNTQKIEITAGLRPILKQVDIVTWNGTSARTFTVDPTTFSAWIYANPAVPGFTAGSDYSLGLADGEYITDIRWVGQDLPMGSGAGQFLRYDGTSTPAFAASGLLAMTNRVTNNYGQNEYKPGQAPSATGVTSYTATATATYFASTIDPQVSKTAVSNVSKLQPGDTATWRVRISNGPGATRAMTPKIVDVLPVGLEFQPRSAVWSNLGSLPQPTQTLGTIQIDGTTRTTVTWSWPAGTDLAPTTHGGPTPTVTFDTLVTLGATDGVHSGREGQRAALFDTVGPWDASGKPAPADSDDLDGDGDTTENYAEATAPWTVPVAAGAVIRKSVKGALDADWTTEGLTSATYTGTDSTIDYRFEISNPNTTALTDLVLYDVLPYVGDHGISQAVDDQERGSQWAPLFAAVTSLPAGASVEYSTSSDPCRPELYDGAAGQAKPSGCADDWSTSAPADPSTVRAIKVTIPRIEAGATAGDVQLRMTAPALSGAADAAITNPQAVANNNVAWHVNRETAAGTTQSLPAAEAALVSVRRAAGIVGDRVWLDANRDGLQTAGETGVEGITVHLLDAAGAPILDGAGDPITTITDDDGLYRFAVPLGTYTVSFDSIPAKYELTAAAVGVDDAVDSDAPGVGIPTHAVTIADPVRAGADANVDLRLDAGLVLAQLAIAKTDGVDIVQPGEETTYVVSVTNLSTAAAAVDVPVTDQLPAELDYVSSDHLGFYDAVGHRVLWTIPTIAPGATVALSVTTAVRDDVRADTEIRNVATLPAEVCTVDCEATDIDRTPPRVTIVKDDHRETVAVGEQLTYDLVVTNHSDATAATGVVVTDALPQQHLGFVSASDGGVYDTDTHSVTWSLGDLAPGEGRLVQVTAVVTGAADDGSITNGASVTTDQGCVDGGCTTTDIDHVDPPTPPAPPSSEQPTALAHTGIDAMTAVLAAAALLALGLLLALRRRRTAA